MVTGGGQVKLPGPGLGKPTERIEVDEFPRSP
jgi:hypothetical protein